jgi:hypothetical protein
MTGSTENLSQPSFEEKAANQAALLPIYAALVREFVIEVSTGPIDDGGSASPETVEQAAAWFLQVDSQIQVHQLRQFLQSTPLMNEGVLRQLLLHHIRKSVKSSSDRDKTDYLLVQYFSLCAPSGLEDADVDLDYVAQVLEPVLGAPQPETPAWLNSLDTIMHSAAKCRRLSELLHGGVLEQGRTLKAENAAHYFEPPAMVAFARFGFMVRRIFFRLMQNDLNTIQDGLRELERRGIPTIDCRRAQFSAEEPITRLRMICQSWRVMFHAEYSSGQPLRMLVDLRAAVDDALHNTAPNHSQAAVASGTSAGERKN